MERTKVKPFSGNEIPNELSLYKLSGKSPSEFKKYFRNAETGRTGLQAKREQSKAAMPFSAKTMIQKYLKVKNGRKKMKFSLGRILRTNSSRS